MASMTAAPSTELRKARPHDVRLMPHMLQAFHRDVAVSKAKAITNDHVRRIKAASSRMVLPSRTWLARSTWPW